MNEINITMLLSIIKNKGNIKKLKRQKLSFKQIIELTEEAVNVGYVSYKDGQIVLTIAGEAFLEKNFVLIKKTNKDEWIELDFKNKVKPFPKNDVFLPDRNEMYF